MWRRGLHPDLSGRPTGGGELSALFDGIARIVISGIDGDVADLPPEERAHIARAIPSRQREFATGRKLARRALAQIGFENALVLAGPDRAPIWPDGAVGSIAHCSNLCIAAVARTAQVRSIGVDVEPFAGLDAELWDHVMVAAERAWLDTQPATHRPHLARMVFVAKEAYYKAQYPITGALLDFKDVAVKISVRRERFTARCLRSNSGTPLMRPLEGTLCAADEWLFAGVAVR